LRALRIRLPTLLAILLAVPASGQQAEDAGASVPSFEEGDVISFGEVEKLRAFLPKEFWDNRDFFFFDGMQLTVGPTQADYTPAAAYKEATERFRGQPRSGAAAAVARSSSTRTGTAANSFPSTTKAAARPSTCPIGSRSSTSTRTTATSSAARSASTPPGSRWTRPSTRAASCC
jgi:hypothetical protein